jgi:hypothetical protein
MPLQYDEVYNLQNYATQPMSQIRRDFTLPNNHIGWTLALHGWMALWDIRLATLSEAAIRFLPGLLSTGGILAFVLVLRSSLPAGIGLWFAFVGAAVLALQRQFYYVMPVSLRGYWASIACMAMLMLALQSTGKQFGFLRAIVAFALLFYFSYILPSNLWFAAPVAGMVMVLVLWVRMRRTDESAQDSAGMRLKSAMKEKPFWLPIVSMLLALLAVRVAYAPVWEQIRAGSAPAKSIGEFISRLPRQLTDFSKVLCLTRTPVIDWLVILAGAVTTGFLALRGDERARWSFCVAAVPSLTWPLLVAYSTTNAFVRNFSPVAPLALLTYFWGIIGICMLIAKLPALQLKVREQIVRVGPAVALVLLVAGAGLHCYQDQRRTYNAFQPAKLVSMLNSELSSPRSLATYACSDYAVAIDYYVQRLRASRPVVHVDQLPVGAIPQLEKLLLVTQNTAEADSMAERWKLGAKWRESHPPIAQVGGFLVYRVR